MEIFEIDSVDNLIICLFCLYNNWDYKYNCMYSLVLKIAHNTRIKDTIAIARGLYRVT